MEATSSAVRSLRVLVAEDDDELRALLVYALERAGHQVIELEDGFELSDYLELSNHDVSKRLEPDVILTDLRMPGLSGVEVVRQARSIGLTCPVIVITAFPDAALFDEAERFGRTVVLAKPVELAAVTALVAELVH